MVELDGSTRWQDLTIGGHLVNLAGSSLAIDNYQQDAVFSIGSGGTLTNEGLIDSPRDPIVNRGYFHNTPGAEISADISNGLGATFDNEGRFAGLVDNRGTVRLHEDGYYFNGYIWNRPSGLLEIRHSSSVSVENEGEVFIPASGWLGLGSWFRQAASGTTRVAGVIEFWADMTLQGRWLGEPGARLIASRRDLTIASGAEVAFNSIGATDSRIHNDGLLQILAPVDPLNPSVGLSVTSLVGDGTLRVEGAVVGAGQLQQSRIEFVRGEIWVGDFTQAADESFSIQLGNPDTQMTT